MAGLALCGEEGEGRRWRGEWWEDGVREEGGWEARGWAEGEGGRKGGEIGRGRMEGEHHELR